MDFKNLLPAKNRDELRQWLQKNHNKESECWVVVKRGRPVDNGTFWYIDAVEEAMCFGWIDSTTKKMDNGITAQRLAPRRKGSLWSELNKERCRRMERLGRMTDAGRAVLPDMSEKGFNFTGNYNLTILDIREVFIGDNVMIGPNTLITTVGHPLSPMGRRKHIGIAKPVHIGNDVWIGGNVTILPGVMIGNNVIVAAGAVVTKDIPDNCLVGGVPAKVIKKIEDDTI